MAKKLLLANLVQATPTVCLLSQLHRMDQGNYGNNFLNITGKKTWRTSSCKVMISEKELKEHILNILLNNIAHLKYSSQSWT